MDMTGSEMGTPRKIPEIFMNTHQEFFVEKELFEIQYEEGHILYAPLKSVVLQTNKNLINLICDIDKGNPVDLKANQEIIDKLKKFGIIYEKSDIPDVTNKNAPDFSKPFLPLNLTLFLTGDCNLACRYCYGDGGDKKIDMPMEIAMDAIDLLFLNAAKSEAKHVHLGFHGGGEPVLKISTMKKLTDQARNIAKKRNVGLTLGLTTNAVMSESSAEWVADHIDQLNISFDGPEDIQNYQRPMKDGRPSYDRLVQTLSILESHRKKYSLRGTLTRYSQDRIPEIVNHFVENFTPAGIHLEPMFVSKRADHTKLKGVDPEKFVKGFLEGTKIAAEKGIYCYFSGYRFPKLSNNFCGIGWKNFAVTPEGNVTSCFEVLSDEDKRSETFFYGKHVKNKGFVIDFDKIKALRELSGKKFECCQNCFVKFQCAGDCRAKGLYLNDISNYNGGGRCYIIQELTKAGLIEQLNSERGGCERKEQ